MDWLKRADVLMTVLSGSRARGMDVTQEDVDKGLATKVSDWDFRSVYVFRHRDEWRLDENAPEQFTGKIDPKYEPAEHDMFHLRKFMRLVYKPSPEHVEMLWSDVVMQDHIPMMHKGSMLRALRYKFSSKDLVRRYVKAAGEVTSEAVNEHKLLSDAEFEKGVGRSHLLGRAIHYRTEDPQESWKAIADVLRRLYVAQQLLLDKTNSLQAIDESKAALSHLGYWLEAASRLNVKLPDDGYVVYNEKDGLLRLRPEPVVLEYLRNVRFGRVGWLDALEYRNDLYDQVELLLQTSKLRDEADPVWGDIFLQYVALTTNV